MRRRIATADAHVQLLAAVAVSLALICIAYCRHDRRPDRQAQAAPPPAPPKWWQRPTPTPTPTPSPTATTPPAPTTPYSPLHVTIAAVGIDASVQPVGTTPDGQMEIPPDPMVVGWWQGSALARSRGGQHGAGRTCFQHRLGPGSLRETEAGHGWHHRRHHRPGRFPTPYTVTSVESIHKTQFPASRVFSSSGPHQLVLATCADYDQVTSHWEDNLLVFASPA